MPLTPWGVQKCPPQKKKHTKKAKNNQKKSLKMAPAAEPRRLHHDRSRPARSPGGCLCPNSSELGRPAPFPPPFPLFFLIIFFLNVFLMFFVVFWGSSSRPKMAAAASGPKMAAPSGPFPPFPRRHFVTPPQNPRFYSFLTNFCSSKPLKSPQNAAGIPHKGSQMAAGASEP